MAASRRTCPSCHHRLSPLAVECPVCGLGLGQRTLARPLLFQASALRGPVAPPTRIPAAPATGGQALRAPALGRVAPVEFDSALDAPAPLPLPLPEAEPRILQYAPESGLQQRADLEEGTTSLWPLVLMEMNEALLVAAANLVLAAAACLVSGVRPTRLYTEAWPYLAPVHLAVSWALVLVPLVLTGQSLPMAPRGLALASDQPERRIAFSLLHLLSAVAFPLSFLCLVLTPEHRTLAELLSGQELLQRPSPRLK